MVKQIGLAAASLRTYAAFHLLVASAIPALSAVDPAAGQRDFVARCGGCHATAPGDSKVGPSLSGVFGSESGKVAGFNYSAALKNAHLKWDDATLDKWLQSSSGLVHGTTMFVSIPSSGDRENLIAYLKTLSTGQNPTSASTQ